MALINIITLSGCVAAVSVYNNVTTDYSSTELVSSGTVETGTADIIRHGIGEYINAGLGIEADASEALLSSFSSTLLADSIPTHPRKVSNDSTTTTMSSATASPPLAVNANITSAAYPNATEAGYADATGVITVDINYSGDCWDRWNQYWTTSSSVYTLGLFVTKTRITTPHAQTAPVSTNYITSVRRDNLTMFDPSCSLPSIVPSCASSWSSYAEGSLREAPPCSQASVGEKACNSVREDYLWNVKGVVMNPFFTNPGYLPNGSWPTQSSLAPSCTLGCAGCAITGNSVELLFWPEQTAAPSADGVGWYNGTARPVNPHPGSVTAVSGAYTFTSPTIYISYDTLYAANSCSAIGAVYNNTILPLTNPDHLSSLMLTAMNPGLFGPVYTYYTSASFNISDLNSPIPQSIYNQAPECQAESLKSCYGGGVGETCAFVCPTNKPYAPIIAVPMELTDLHPEWKSCTPWYGGLYDPPIALTQAPTADVITPPGVGAEPTTTPAAEAPKITPPVHTPTSDNEDMPAPTPDDPPHDPKPPENGSPTGASPASGNPTDQRPEHDNQPSDVSPGQSRPGNDRPDDSSSQPSPASGPPNDLVQDSANQPVHGLEPSSANSFVFNPQPSINDGTPTNALEVLTAALTSDPAGPNSAESPPHVTPPPAFGSGAISHPAVQVSRSGSAYFIGTEALSQNAVVTIGGAAYSINPTGDLEIVSPTSFSLAANEGTAVSAWSYGPGSLAISRLDDVRVVVAQNTLTVGEVATYRGVSVSIGSDGNIVVQGTARVELEDGGSTVVPCSTMRPEDELWRFNDGLVVAGITVDTGEVATVNGIKMSIGTDGKVVVDGSTMMSLDVGDSTTGPWVTTTPGVEMDEFEVTLMVGGRTFSIGGECATVCEIQNTSVQATTTEKSEQPGRTKAQTQTAIGDAGDNARSPEPTETSGTTQRRATLPWSLAAVVGLIVVKKL